jgi:Spy/CpxP family protein refolding chaperone
MNRALQWSLVAGFILVFLAGGVTGAFFGASQVRHRFFEPHKGLMNERMRERLRVQLDLTPEQVAQLSPIIDKTTAELEQIRRETARRVRETFAESHEQMTAALTEEQRAKLRKIELRHGHKRRFHEHRRPRRPHAADHDSVSQPNYRH